MADSAKTEPTQAMRNAAPEAKKAIAELLKPYKDIPDRFDFKFKRDSVADLLDDIASGKSIGSAQLEEARQDLKDLMAQRKLEIKAHVAKNANHGDDMGKFIDNEVRSLQVIVESTDKLLIDIQRKLEINEGKSPAPREKPAIQAAVQPAQVKQSVGSIMNNRSGSDALVYSYRNSNPGKITDAEAELLKSNKGLTDLIFNNGAVSLITSGKVTVAQLASASPGVLDSLRYDIIQRSVNKGALSLEQLSIIPAPDLKQAAELSLKGTWQPAQANLLRLDEKQINLFKKAIAEHADAINPPVPPSIRATSPSVGR